MNPNAQVRSMLTADPTLAPRILAMFAMDAQSVIVRSPHDAERVFRPHLAGSSCERLALMALDRRRKVIGIETLTIGTDGFTVVDPRQIFRWALAQGKSGAHAVIMAHNHPSGDPTPSEQDREITRRVASAGKALGIAVLDHMVMTDHGGYTSLAQDGLLPAWTQDVGFTNDGR